MKNYLTIIALLISISLNAQLKPIGSWTDHLPYNVGRSIASDGENIYAATESGLFTYNTKDNSISKFSKVNILNDVEINKISYSFDFETLIIVYDNGNIDILVDNNVTNIPFIKLSNETKTANEINIIGQFAYISFEYGISVVDLVKKEIVDTYKFGTNGSDIFINSTTVYQSKIFAASIDGFYTADINTNLLDFNNWKKNAFKSTSLIKKITEINDQLLFVIRDDNSGGDSTFKFDGNNYEYLPSLSNIIFRSVEKINEENYILNTENISYFFAKDFSIKNVVFHNNGNLIGSAIANNRYFYLNRKDPLVELDTTTEQAINLIRPNGPGGKGIFDMDASNGVIWTANGGHNFAYNNTNNNAALYQYDGTTWKTYEPFNPPSLTGKFDVLAVTANPNKKNEVFFGTWGGGILRYNEKLPFITFKDTNSSLKVREALIQFNWVGAGEGAFDEEGNFWTTNTYQKNALSVRKVDGTWKSFDLSNVITSGETAVFDIAIDNNGYKWLTLPKNNSIVVFDDNGTIDNKSDDQSILLTPSVGNGSIPGGRGIKIETDNDGLIWIGTSDGIAVHFNPGGVFDGDLDFDRIIFNDGENNEILLQNSVVKEIAVDGFNRKWISAENSGILLVSDDGKETILDFNTENSPLISNQVEAITIDETTGEVYIATDKGLVSYRGEALGGKENLNNISVYPNPVRADYTGKIAINGLMDNSTVKITDINGTLINEIKSQGGQILWDGNNFNGKRASTGIYLILVSGEDEENDFKTEIGKIMFVN